MLKFIYFILAVMLKIYSLPCDTYCPIDALILTVTLVQDNSVVFNHTLVSVVLVTLIPFTNTL